MMTVRSHPRICVGGLYVQSQASDGVTTHPGFLRGVLRCKHLKTSYILQETRKPGYFKKTLQSLF